MTIFYSQNIKSQKNVHKILLIILTIIVILSFALQMQIYLMFIIFK